MQEEIAPNEALLRWNTGKAESFNPHQFRQREELVEESQDVLLRSLDVHLNLEPVHTVIARERARLEIQMEIGAPRERF